MGDGQIFVIVCALQIWGFVALCFLFCNQVTSGAGRDDHRDRTSDTRTLRYDETRQAAIQAEVQERTNFRHWWSRDARESGGGTVHSNYDHRNWVLMQASSFVPIFTISPFVLQDMIVEHLEKRYNKSQVYTYIGDILLAVNPFTPLTIYSDEVWLYSICHWNMFQWKITFRRYDFRI